MTEKKTTSRSQTKAGTDREEAVSAAKSDDPRAREEALAERERALEERERQLAAREAAAPRERENMQSSRSRATDDTRRMERPSMNQYAPPSVLEVPHDPEYHYRWVAEWVNGTNTPRNVQQRLREGYERVRIDELHEDFLVDEDLQGDGYARTSGLILMRIHISLKTARDQYYLRKSRERLEAADDLQGVAGRNAVREDRGTRSLTGTDAMQALTTMSQT